MDTRVKPAYDGLNGRHKSIDNRHCFDYIGRVILLTVKDVIR